MKMTETEAELRRDLAAVFRAMSALGMTEQIAGHNSMMLPEDATGSEPMFLINPRGWHFSEITASRLLLCKLDGTVVRGEGELRRVAFHIHARIHTQHPGARCVLHTHPKYLTALSLIEGGRMAFTHQNDMALADQFRMQHRGAWSDYFDARQHLDSWRRRLDKSDPDYAD